MNWQKMWQNYLNVLKKYTAFDGRAGREEFWLFALVNLIISFVLSFIGPLGYLYSLAVLIPCLAVGARRLHDTGRSGWFLLLGFIPLAGPIALIVLMAQAGQLADNAYGPARIAAKE
jgi:uncharacterized membrane protein YhaH (DUF805 family)